MAVTQLHRSPVDSASPEELARAIRADCDRAIRRLNVLIDERDDVLLQHAREAVRHAALMSDRLGGDCARRASAA